MTKDEEEREPDALVPKDKDALVPEDKEEDSGAQLRQFFESLPPVLAQLHQNQMELAEKQLQVAQEHTAAERSRIEAQAELAREAMTRKMTADEKDQGGRRVLVWVLVGGFMALSAVLAFTDNASAIPAVLALQVAVVGIVLNRSSSGPTPPQG